MKNKLKKPFKLGIILFTVSLFVVSCQKEDSLHSNRENPNTFAFKVSKINSTVVKQNNTLNNTLTKLKEQLKETKTNALNRTVYSNEYGFSINTDYVTYIENYDASYHSYTFSIFRDIDNGLIENLLLSLNEDGSYKAFIVSYNITEQEQEDMLNGLEVNLTDKVIFTEINAENLASNIFSRPGLCGYSSELICWEEACPIDGCWDSEYTISNCKSILVYNDDCDTEIGGGGNTNPPNGGGGGGNTSNNTSHTGTNNTSVTTLNVLTIAEKIENCLNGVAQVGSADTTIITPGTIDALNLGKAQLNEISNYLITQKNCSEEAQEFALLAVENNADIGDIIFVVENLQDYRNIMSEDELNLFDSLNNEEQTLYLVSAKQALDKTDEIFSTFCERYNGKGDAFRHAYWNALSSQRIGIGLTDQLTTRHENRPPSYSYSSKETEMDLFNNDIGRGLVFDGMTNPLLTQQAIEDLLNNGSLRYLTNLNPNLEQEQCRATFTSQLIPTNQ